MKIQEKMTVSPSNITKSPRLSVDLFLLLFIKKGEKRTNKFVSKKVKIGNTR